MILELPQILLLLAAAFFGGLLNAIAGGGSFLTLPALMLAGAPAITANATGTVALLPGYIASAWGFRKTLRHASPLSLTALTILSLLGGAAGALLLLLTSNETFQKLVPWLLLFATAIFAFAPRLLNKSSPTPDTPNAETIAPRPLYILGILIVSIYGGYFNGGLGIMLLATLALLGHQNLLAMNSLKNLLLTTITLLAVALYATGQLVDWTAALLMTPAAITGGFAGAWIGHRVPAHYIRAIAIATGLIIALLFFIL